MTDKHSSKNPPLQIDHGLPSGMSMLNAISVATQALIDVKPPAGQLYPVSLHTLVITNAGERKSVTDSIVSRKLLRVRNKEKP